MSAANQTIDLRRDRVELKAGITNLPNLYREIAQLANKAGLNGFEFVDAETGIDIEEARRVMERPSQDERYRAIVEEMKSWVTISYRRQDGHAQGELLDACRMIKGYLNKLESGSDPDDPLRAIRETYHAPLHAALDKAIQAAEGRA